MSDWHVGLVEPCGPRACQPRVAGLCCRSPTSKNLLSRGMEMPRKLLSAGCRSLFGLLFGLLALVCTTAVVAAADYPTRPVTIVVGFPPGGASDILARLVANKMASVLGQPF